VWRDGPPRAPATGGSHREGRHGRGRRVVQHYLHQTADPGARAGGYPSVELCGARPEIDACIREHVTTTSCTVVTAGWLSWAAARASRSVRQYRLSRSARLTPGGNRTSLIAAGTTENFVPAAPYRAHGALANRCSQPVALADELRIPTGQPLRYIRYSRLDRGRADCGPGARALSKLPFWRIHCVPSALAHRWTAPLVFVPPTDQQRNWPLRPATRHRA